MVPRPDHGEHSYRGSGRLTGKAALVTGADSGIGRAVAIAFAREGADVIVSYLDEHEDAEETRRWVEEAGRACVLAPGDLADPAHCRALIDLAVEEFTRLDVLVSNAAFQVARESLEEIPDEEWDRTVAINHSAFFHLTKAAVPYMPAGSSIIATTSIVADAPTPRLVAYDATKGALTTMVGALAQLVSIEGIRVNAVAPGPIWTPLIPSTLPPEHVASFGTATPMGRPGQPAEVAPVYVLLASDEASYVSGAKVAVTGGRPVP